MARRKGKGEVNQNEAVSAAFFMLGTGWGLDRYPNMKNAAKLAVFSCLGDGDGDGDGDGEVKHENEAEIASYSCRECGRD